MLFFLSELMTFNKIQSPNIFVLYFYIKPHNIRYMFFLFVFVVAYFF
eukprot:UN13400